uniref:Uncharacterized protein n=1 Tax=Janibacter limosus TaxID=53458 RepID=A0AC61U3N8_9MICO|nr:hypothetical protein [Janibacter limosus]
MDDVLGADEVLRPGLVEHAARLRDLALARRHADALRALGEHRLLCAHRDGPGASARGTTASSAGSVRPPTTPDAGSSDARCSSRPTTVASASTTATPA